MDILGRDWPRLDDVLLLVTEVASNAIRHTASGSGQFAVTADVLACGRWVRVEVADQGAATEPAILAGGNGSIGLTCGRGLQIVDVLADRWGYDGDELGRVVWFEVAAKPHTDESGSG